MAIAGGEGVPEPWSRDRPRLRSWAPGRRGAVRQLAGSWQEGRRYGPAKIGGTSRRDGSPGAWWKAVREVSPAAAVAAAPRGPAETVPGGYPPGRENARKRTASSRAGVSPEVCRAAVGRLASDTRRRRLMAKTGAQLRSAFLAISSGTGTRSCQRLPHSGERPTLLFTNSGWSSSRKYFLGMTSASFRRAATSQRCCGSAASTTTWRTWGTRRGTTPCSRCWGTSPSATTQEGCDLLGWDFLTREVGLDGKR